MNKKDLPMAPEERLTPLVPLAPQASAESGILEGGCCPPPGPDADAPC